jgi:hypothetical protein
VIAAGSRGKPHFSGSPLHHQQLERISPSVIGGPAWDHGANSIVTSAERRTVELDRSGVFGRIRALRRAREKGTGVMATELIRQGVNFPKKMKPRRLGGRRGFDISNGRLASESVTTNQANPDSEA